MVRDQKRSIKAKILRGLTAAILIGILLNTIVAMTTTYWQVGNCREKWHCVWHESLPWKTWWRQDDATQFSQWQPLRIVILFFCVATAFMAFVALILLLVEAFAKKVKLHVRVMRAVLAFIIISFLCCLVGWIVYIIAEWSLRGWLSWSFYIFAFTCLSHIAAFFIYYQAMKWDKERCRKYGIPRPGSSDTKDKKKPPKNSQEKQ